MWLDFLNGVLNFLEFCRKGWKFFFGCAILCVSINCGSIPRENELFGERIMLELLAPAGSMEALRAAVQALRGTLTERERQSARDTRLVTTLCFSLSLLVTILLI